MKDKIAKHIKYNWQIYVLFIPALIWMVMFVFVPFGRNVIMSFQDYIPQPDNVKLPNRGILGSEFCWFDNYVDFFTAGDFWKLLGNTFALNLMTLAIGFPAAIVLAIMIYESKSGAIKGFAQTATFLPFFISSVVVCNLVIEFLKADTGMLVTIFEWFGMDRKNLLEDPRYFRIIYSIMDLWQTVGYNSLVYIAALSAIDTSLFEAASIDGAGKFKQIWHVTLPGIAPTIIITLILKVGKLMSLGYEKVLILQQVKGNKATSEILSTYVYNMTLGSQAPNYGLSAAIGIFDAVVAIVLVVLVNKLAKKVSDTALW